MMTDSLRPNLAERLNETSFATFINSTAEELYEESLRRGEGELTKCGALAVNTGKHTARAVKDRFIVEEPTTKEKIWWGATNQPISGAVFNKLHQKMSQHFESRDIFVQDCFCGTDSKLRLPIRVISESAWHSLFARNMFVLKEDTTQEHHPEFTVLHAPTFKADPQVDGTNSSAFIIISFEKKTVLIGGTAYAGEIKKSIFSVMNYLLPEKAILPMHCSANIGESKDSALFFGLSGTGKTTLSADPSRHLIGDDEHGWCDTGVFNFEGGCYAKLIRLSPEAEPDIYRCTETFGTILENVVYSKTTRKLDLDDDTYTENTRASYPITHIPGALINGMGDHPKNVIFLTCDSFGVMPPVAKLTTAQAMYYFISGYTAKVGATEVGLGKEPQATFSPCFGAPFMPRHPATYAELLRKRVEENNTTCWLVNTGWTGGPYGVGSRMSIQYTRKIIDAVLAGRLKDRTCETHPVFGFQVPTVCLDVPSEILNPRNTWSDKSAYDKAAQDLATKFAKHFEPFKDLVSEDVRAAAPKA